MLWTENKGLWMHICMCVSIWESVRSESDELEEEAEDRLQNLLVCCFPWMCVFPCGCEGWSWGLEPFILGLFLCWWGPTEEWGKHWSYGLDVQSRCSGFVQPVNWSLPHPWFPQKDPCDQGICSGRSFLEKSMGGESAHEFKTVILWARPYKVGRGKVLCAVLIGKCRLRN